MTQRLLSKMKWLMILAVYAGPNWNPVRAVTVRTPPKNPSTIEAQAKFFQDFFSVQLSPYKIEFGHVCEDPNTWQQRYEKKDFKNHRDMGKVRWGDKHGGYGEHYWDLNHAGHAADNDNGFESNSDDGSYRGDDHSDVYEEPSDYSPTYDDGYDPEKAAAYDESGRAKRAHVRTKSEKHTQENSDDSNENNDEEDEDIEEETEPPQLKRKQNKTKNNHNRQKSDEVFKKTVTTKGQKSYGRPHEQYEETEDGQDDKKQVVLVFSHKNRQTHQENQQKPTQDPHQYQTTSKNPSSYAPYDGVPKFYQSSSQNPSSHVSHEAKTREYQTTSKNPSSHVPYEDKSEEYQTTSKNLASFVPNEGNQRKYQTTTKNPLSNVPYEGGSGVRQHRFFETSAPPPQVSRLFLEPSTGHIVDRATGQAFVLQPIAESNYNLNKHYE